MSIRNTTIKDGNARVQHMAAEHGAIFVDYHQYFVAEDGLTLRDGFAEDGLHPQANGYKLMANTLLLQVSSVTFLRADKWLLT
jgi:lysophospholipase L1-like esterase